MRAGLGILETAREYAQRVEARWDLAALGVQLKIIQATVDQFRTGWFLESVMTELLIMLVVRTQVPFFRSRPGRPLLIGTLIIAGITLILPYSPLNAVLGFTPLPVSLLLALGGITALYITTTEVVKRVSYHRVRF